MRTIAVAAILRKHGKWIESGEFVPLVTKKRNVKDRRAYGLIKKAYDDKEIKKHVLTDRTVLYGLPEFGPAIAQGAEKYDKDDFLNFGVEHDLISVEDLRKMRLPIEKVPKMFQKGDVMWPLRLKAIEKLDIEQLLVLWFHQDVFQFLHAARKIMGNKNDVTDKERSSENAARWVSSTASWVAEGWKECLEWIAREGKSSWESILGSLEDNQLPLLQGLCKYEERIQNALKKEEEEDERKVKSGEMKSYSMRGLRKELDRRIKEQARAFRFVTFGVLSNIAVRSFKFQFVTREGSSKGI
ncbi:hypothetical protein MUP01_04970 [Candidatus Bathyarchaeota archaeon]|nr:hypothetical protein [Candidatus Bathyarchaeota archaeon]